MAKDIRIIKEFEALNLDHFAKNWIKSRHEKPSEGEIKAYLTGRESNIPSENLSRAWEMISKFGELCK
ncbi:unnamed protein product [marine sediment metagenome]|uniref:Uncharacterized protein n=1 Tax=marine sediment metagenome TaxID=412755 RepID=X1LWY3_9ZZZZ